MVAIALKNNLTTILVYLIVVQIPMLIVYYFADELGISNLWLYFICLIIGLRIAFFKDDYFKKRVEGGLFKQLQSKFKKSPSKSEIVKALNMTMSFRDAIFFGNLILLLILTALFNQF
ncbi:MULTISPECIES: hypothetical protein [Halobacteriovorax]|uniref:DUF3899 domain-containing protein n=1 Tax=Halobacteriovorax vibrionivorans TaxID=2152716 RepID=A0ABY0IIC3_9BACT|nr:MULTISPECIES: hypothetical protein [Halobacteriovorax]AYF45275.1 hypothetical protein BALOs_2277 [Halobacteriovorax sp. BALOs_7]RZF22362.1 hypothetical protein DAY19_00920 [Halobacteriovorax vibrionivorans]TGD48614.1 hypothetical protein EP118_03835 [Halobacteriovorax sp. Y22]